MFEKSGYEDRLELDTLFKPSSIAVVGASKDRAKIGNIVIRNLLSTYNSKIYAVNDNTEVVEGLSCFKSVKNIETVVDLIIIAVPRQFVPEVMEDSVKNGARSAIIISSGFRELDDQGAKLEAQTLQIARSGGIRFLGPNTLGLLTPSFNATFALADVKRGPLALVAQSGGIGVYMLNWASKTRTGISYFIGLGNQADISESEVYDYLATDIETRSIFSYNEGVADGKRFLQTLPNVTSRKPAVFLKGGIGKGGTAAVKTHTGSLAGSSEIFRAAVKTVGGIYVENLEEFLDISKLIHVKDVVRQDILIVTNSGGHGVLATDEVERQGLHLVELPKEITETLKPVMPPQSLPNNPLDLSGDADKERYEKVMGIVKEIDCSKLVMVQTLPMISCSEVARLLVDSKYKGVIGVMMGMDEDAAVRTLESTGIPSYTFPEDAIKSIKYVSQAQAPRLKVQIPKPIPEAESLVRSKQKLGDQEALELVQIYGLQTPGWDIAKSAQEARSIADKMDFPIVMKIAPDEPLHKTDIGGVVLNVESDEVEKVYSRLAQITQNVMVQEQLSGAEVFLGGIEDAVFGKAAVVGIGGVYVEVIKSVSYGLCPIDNDEALEMLAQSRVHELLSARKRGYDETSVSNAIVTLSKMIIDLNLKQVDINPLIVNEKGSFAVDVRVVA